MRHALFPALLLAVAAAQGFDFTSAKTRAVNREVSRLAERGGVHLSPKEGPGVAWIEGSDFGDGTIELDVRGKDVLQQSFVGVAFHRKDDQTYESVYLRPFNFQASDPAAQPCRSAMQVPEFDWPVLREVPEFERLSARRSNRPTGAPACRRQGRPHPGVRRVRDDADARRPQARTARWRNGRSVGGEQQRRRFRELASGEIGIPVPDARGFNAPSARFGKANQRPLRTEWIRAASARLAGVGEVRTRSSITRSLSASRFIAR